MITKHIEMFALRYGQTKGLIFLQITGLERGQVIPIQFKNFSPWDFTFPYEENLTNPFVGSRFYLFDYLVTN